MIKVGIIKIFMENIKDADPIFLKLMIKIIFL